VLPLLIDDFDYDLIQKSSDVIELYPVFKIPTSESFENILKSLSREDYFCTKEKFDCSIDFIASNFSKMNLELFQKLPVQVIETMLTSKSLLLPSETFLFKLVFSHKHCNKFMKYACLPAIELQELQPFLEELEIKSVTSDLFQCLKNFFIFRKINFLKIDGLKCQLSDI
jgi:hypothetical protein